MAASSSSTSSYAEERGTEEGVSKDAPILPRVGGYEDYRSIHPRVTLFSIEELVAFLDVVPEPVTQAFIDVYRPQNPHYGKEVGETGKVVQVTDHQWIKDLTDSKQTMVVVVFDEETGTLPRAFCSMQARRSPVSGIFITMFAVAEDAGPRVPLADRDRSVQCFESVAGLLFHACCKAFPEVHRRLRDIFEGDIHRQRMEVERNPEGATAKEESEKYGRRQRRALKKFRENPSFVKPRLVLPLWREAPTMNDWHRFKKSFAGGRRLRVMSRKDWEEERSDKSEDAQIFHQEHSIFYISFSSV